MPARYTFYNRANGRTVMSNPAATDFFTVFPVNQYVHYGIAAHPQDFSRKFHGHATKVITEIIRNQQALPVLVRLGIFRQWWHLPVARKKKQGKCWKNLISRILKPRKMLSERKE